MPGRFHISPINEDTCLPGISGNLPCEGTEFFWSASDNSDMLQNMAQFLLALRDTGIMRYNNCFIVSSPIDRIGPSCELKLLQASRWSKISTQDSYTHTHCPKPFFPSKQLLGLQNHLCWWHPPGLQGREHSHSEVALSLSYGMPSIHLSWQLLP